MGIIKKPNFPQRKAKTVLISNRAKEGIGELERNGIKALKTCDFGKIAAPVAHHPDMQFSHLCENLCVVFNQDSSLAKKLSDIGFSVIAAKNQYSSDYPYDIGLNCVIINSMVIGKIRYLDQAVTQSLCDYEFIDVPQGYTKCAVCIVDEESLITEDESLYNVLKHKLDVLKIESGCVELKGYQYGFFGGCTGLVDKNVLAVNGQLQFHKSYNLIRGFLKERDIDVLELRKGNLTDIGSIIPLEEQ